MIFIVKTWLKQLGHGILLPRPKLGVNKTKVQKIRNVQIMVKNLEEAGKFFADLFGVEFTGPNEIKEADIRHLASPIGLQLIAPLTPDGPVAKALERRGEGLYMLRLTVPNLEEAIADMESHGVKLAGRFPSSRAALFHPKDLHGVMIEIMDS